MTVATDCTTYCKIKKEWLLCLFLNIWSVKYREPASRKLVRNWFYLFLHSLLVPSSLFTLLLFNPLLTLPTTSCNITALWILICFLCPRTSLQFSISLRCPYPLFISAFSPPATMDLTLWQYQFRIIMLGDSTVGKSSLLKRYTEDLFLESINQTVGVDFYVHFLEVEPGVRVKLQFWDTAGQERFRWGSTHVVVIWNKAFVFCTGAGHSLTTLQKS